MNTPTDIEMLRDNSKESIEATLRLEAAKRKQIIELKSQLEYYEQLQSYPPFQQFLKDMTDREEAAFEAMDRSTTEAEAMKSMGEYIGVRRALKHVGERITTLSTTLAEHLDADR